MKTSSVPSVRARLLAALKDNISRLPAESRKDVRDAFTSDKAPRNLNALAKSIGVSRRSLDRWLDDAGFVGGRRMLSAIRTARAWELVRARTDRSAAKVWKGAGFTSERLMRSQIRPSLGLSFDKFADIKDHKGLADKLAAWVVAKQKRGAARR